MSAVQSLARMTLVAAASAIAYRAVECERSLRRVRKHKLNRVRAAGPEAMKNPPQDWDQVDQQADESFPASDPPGNY